MSCLNLCFICGRNTINLPKKTRNFSKKLEDKKSITDRLDKLERQMAALVGHENGNNHAGAEAEHGGE